MWNLTKNKVKPQFGWSKLAFSWRQKDMSYSFYFCSSIVHQWNFPCCYRNKLTKFKLIVLLSLFRKKSRCKRDSYRVAINDIHRLSIPSENWMNLRKKKRMNWLYKTDDLEIKDGSQLPLKGKDIPPSQPFLLGLIKAMNFGWVSWFTLVLTWFLIMKLAM